MNHILLVDDDHRLRSLLRQYLSDHGYAVSEAASAAEARALLSLLAADVMVLDVMMPGETGLELAASLPSTSRPPILMLTALDAPADRIAGLEAGVEDYLAKPFEPRELLLRLSNILRNRQQQKKASESLRFGPFEFDRASQRLSRSGEAVYLTGVETAILAQLAAAAGEVILRETLVAALGGNETTRGIDVQIGRLRKKIEEDSARPRYIQTIRGEGYRLIV
jgi:two-component system, OmpR family, phosphate regulon response regulator OmpR